MLLVVVLLAVLAAAGCGQPQAAAVDAAAAGVTLTVEPAALAVGETELVVRLARADGTPIEGAKVHVHGDMDHAGMMPVDGEAEGGAGGEYRVPFEWTMGGGWILTVTADLPDGGGTVTQTFAFFVEAVSGESVIHDASSAEGEQMDMDMEATAEHDGH
ncbi:MAG: hypothetical protein Kow0077_28450 [Anaerolineae bacterium]